MLDCSFVNSKLDQFATCERTEDGIKVATHCMYPSFDQVEVFVVGVGDGFIVHDGGGAGRIAWMHGIDAPAFNRSVAQIATAFGCEFVKVRQQIRASASSEAWLWSAVVSVANASADASRAVIYRARKTREYGLIQKTKAILDRAKWKPETKLEAQYPGKSGKTHTFDLAVESNNKTALIDAVVSHPNSIAAKYLAFSDTETRPGLYKYALYENDLTQEDKALISNVADLINFNAISGTDGKFLLQ
ncbi:hypothetical protein [Actibacterium sp. D379-3]